MSKNDSYCYIKALGSEYSRLQVGSRHVTLLANLKPSSKHGFYDCIRNGDFARNVFNWIIVVASAYHLSGK